MAAAARGRLSTSKENDMQRYTAIATFMLVLVLLGAPPLQAAPATGPTPQLQQQLQDYYFGAARSGDTAMLKEFIGIGYDLNTRDAKGYTALILAAYHGQSDAVELLLTSGANACAEDLRGNTALMGAIFKGELRIARRLMAAGCQPDKPNNAGQTAAMYAALFQRTEILQALVQQGADPRRQDQAGNSADSLARGEFQQPRR
jgi:ankyrin repeat protein